MQNEIQTITTQVYRTRDGAEFTSVEAARRHERENILYAFVQETVDADPERAHHTPHDMAQFVLDNFDALMDRFYAHGVLGTVYGTNADFDGTPAEHA